MLIIPYICAEDAEGAIEWYRDVFHAWLPFPPIMGDGGRVGHAELRFGEHKMYLSDVFPGIGTTSPDPERGHSVSLHVDCEGIHDIVVRAEARGAEVRRRPEFVAGVGTVAVLHCPYGHRWMLRQR